MSPPQCAGNATMPMKASRRRTPRRHLGIFKISVSFLPERLPRPCPRGVPATARGWPPRVSISPRQCAGFIALPKLHCGHCGRSAQNLLFLSIFTRLSVSGQRSRISAPQLPQPHPPLRAVFPSKVLVLLHLAVRSHSECAAAVAKLLGRGYACWHRFP